MTITRDDRERLVAVVGPAEGVAPACAELLLHLGTHVTRCAHLDEVPEPLLPVDGVVVVADEGDPEGAGSFDLGTVVGAVARSLDAAVRVITPCGGGSVVVVAPGPAFAVPGAPMLSAASSAVTSLGRSLGRPSESGAIRVNAVAPLVDTPAMAAFFDAHPYLDRNRFTAEQVAPLVAALLGDGCTSTGEIFSAGGGRFARVADVTAAGLFAPHASAELISASIDRVRSLEGSLEPRSILDELLLIDV